MSTLLNASCDAPADPLEGLRLRMIREVEAFLEGSIDRADWRRVIPTRPGSAGSAQTAAKTSSWYHGRIHRSCGESGPC
jgi:hypothetical protein